MIKHHISFFVCFIIIATTTLTTTTIMLYYHYYIIITILLLYYYYYLQGAAASTIPVETFTAAKAEYERLKAEKPDLSDEEAFAALSTYIASLTTTPAPAEGATPAPVEGEAAPAPGEAAPEGETPQEVAPPVEE